LLILEAIWLKYVTYAITPEPWSQALGDSSSLGACRRLRPVDAAPGRNLPVSD